MVTLSKLMQQVYLELCFSVQQVDAELCFVVQQVDAVVIQCCGDVSLDCFEKKYTSVMIRVCHSRSRFMSCMYIHDNFMTESR